jgi:hypothetical protein
MCHLSDYEKDKAKQLFVHYLEEVFKKSNLYWDEDNVSEVEEIVDHVVAAAVYKIKEDIADSMN